MSEPEFDENDPDQPGDPIVNHVYTVSELLDNFVATLEEETDWATNRDLSQD